jgi:hypothetical protein
VLHDRGLARVSSAALSANRAIGLVPWGRVEGVARVGSRANGGKPIQLSITYKDEAGGDPGPNFHYDTTSDAEGRFVFDRVPRGDVSVGLVIRLNDRLSRISRSTFVAVKPGETAHVALGGVGRPVVGRLVAPEGAGEKWEWARGSYSIKPKRPAVAPPPAVAELVKAFGVPTYDVNVAADGTFRCDDVPAGSYELEAHANEPAVAPGTNGNDIRIAGSLRHEFTVPPVSGVQDDESLDLGRLQLKAMTPLNHRR